MPSFRTAFLAVAAVFVAVAQADYVIDPTSVSLATRKNWCQSETSTCPLICQDQSQTNAEVNTCDPVALTYGCLCGDGTQPNVSEYSLTLPYFVCTEWVQQCVTACGSSSSCAGDCQQEHPCGATNPSTANSTNSTATASSGTASATSADATAVFTGVAGQTGSSSSSNASKPPSFEMARLYTMTGTLGLFFVGFAYLL